METNTKRRVLSGMRPTGRLHLGNYMGALYNWVRLQREYSCYFFIADIHALTTDYADPGDIRSKSFEVALDFLGAGLDPEQCVIFRQSAVPAHSELYTLFGMITPLGWLERVPTYKDQQEQLREKELNTHGFLGYPLLQSADILLYKPDFVPVGQDQVSHVELTREVARRFNQLYSSAVTPEVAAAASDKERMKAEISENVIETELLPEPKVLLTPSPKLPGLDGRKMSKSYGNTIGLTDSAEELKKKLRPMVTDPARVRRTDPGDPDKCPVGDLHKVFSTPETLAKVYDGCRNATIGCIECKGWCADSILREIEPIAERRRGFEAQPALVQDILTTGAAKAREQADATMAEVRAAMGL
ncbi:tryptophan--tRNA ligase [Terriglobus aquaticus]|uniref:Tryptophan--tRNA ligase n=1 Tax=Terriglobus aquaticus TaxID=940139 RepID=A0ABW9KH48_9BACT|nr:tryptophan--tRNA ligase [Terriglobus aquaticus]